MERHLTNQINIDRGDNWDQDAACGPLAAAGIFDEYFYPERYDRRAAHIIMAKRICAACPVLIECRADALANNDNMGIKGGMTPTERREFLRRVARQRGPENAS